jgi:hypothetical protein
MARALRDGVDIYTPVAELSKRYFPVATTNFPHPTPHPPLLALLFVPLTLVPFPVVVGLWLALDVALVVVAARWLGLTPLAGLALLAWPPLWWTVDIAQLEVVMLVLLMLGWRAAECGREWRAGLWLGTAGALKYYPLLLLVPFLVRRRVRVLVGAGGVFVAGQIANLLLVGPEGLRRYYLEIVPGVADLWRRAGLNSAPHGALLRLFGGSMDVEPLVHLPWLVAPLTVVCAVLAALALLRLRPEAAPLALLVGLPSAWGYYATLTLPIVVDLWRRRDLRPWSRVACAAASLPLPLVVAALKPLLLAMNWTGDRAPAVAGLLAAVQPAGYLGLLCLVLLAGGAGSSRSPRRAVRAWLRRRQPRLGPDAKEAGRVAPVDAGGLERC